MRARLGTHSVGAGSSIDAIDASYRIDHSRCGSAMRRCCGARTAARPGAVDQPLDRGSRCPVCTQRHRDSRGLRLPSCAVQSDRPAARPPRPLARPFVAPTRTACDCSSRSPSLARHATAPSSALRLDRAARRVGRSSGSDGCVFDDGAYADLGSLKGNVGNQNYAIPASDRSTSRRAPEPVSLWCDRFDVSFGAATLTPV